MSSKDVKQDALDNLADALTEDILNTPDDELLREVEEDYGDRGALANKFDQILERAEKQVLGTARSAAFPQARSSVLGLPISLPDETIRWVKGIFDLGSRLSELLSSLTPRTLAWSATAAAVVILVQAAVITAVVVKEQGASSRSRRPGDVPPLASLTPGHVLPRASLGRKELEPHLAVQEMQAAFLPTLKQPTPKLSDEEIAALVAGGRQLMVAGDIPNARLVLQQAAEANNATAALELGATYDPIEFEKLGVHDSTPDIAMARTWYQKANELGSTEAAGRLERVAGRDGQPR